MSDPIYANRLDSATGVDSEQITPYIGDFKPGDLVTLPDWGPSAVCRVVGVSRKRVASAPGGLSINEPMRDVVDVVMVDDASFAGSYLPGRLTKVEG